MKIQGDLKIITPLIKLKNALRFMEKLFKLNTPIIFVFLIAPYIVADFVDDEFTRKLLNIIFYAFQFSYYLFTYEICQLKLKIENGLIFLISTFSLLVFFGTTSILLLPGEEIEFSGMTAVLIAVLFFGCLLYCLSYIAGLQIRYTHGAKKLDMQNYFFYMMCFFFLPLGIWFVFPRLKKEFEEQKLREL